MKRVRRRRGDAMTGVSRFTVSLPTRLLEAVDQKLVNGSESRSAVVRRLLREALRDAQEREDVEQYIRSYKEHPQTEEEFGWADHVAREGLAAVPWE